MSKTKDSEVQPKIRPEEEREKEYQKEWKKEQEERQRINEQLEKLKRQQYSAGMMIPPSYNEAIRSHSQSPARNGIGFWRPPPAAPAPGHGGPGGNPHAGPYVVQNGGAPIYANRFLPDYQVKKKISKSFFCTKMKK